jgi:hypothetical protein
MEYSVWRSRLAQVGVEYGEDGDYWVRPRREEEVGQGGHAPLGWGPWCLELCHPWLVVAERDSVNESERRG